MSILDWLAAWPNVPFTIAMGTTLLFAAVQASGLLGVLAGGGDADGGPDADVDAAADVDADADADVDADADADGHVSFGAAVLAPLGIGRVPITLTAQIAGLSFAVAGLAMNLAWLGEASSVPLHSLAWTLPTSALVAYATASLAARALAPLVDDRHHAATSRDQMIGAIGRVISTRVTDDFGEIRVRDRSGHDIRIVCRLAPGSREIAELEDAVIVDVDARGALFVAPLDLVESRVESAPGGEPPPARRARRARAR